MTNKIPKVVLIIDKKYKNKQLIYYDRVKKIGNKYGFEVEYITEEILNLDKNGRCQNPSCKCNKTLL